MHRKDLDQAGESGRQDVEPDRSFQPDICTGWISEAQRLRRGARRHAPPNDQSSA
jgi:hypothetical protein